VLSNNTHVAWLHLQVVSQLNTFLLTAFETTAAAIAFALYFIAQHPQVEQRLLQELTQQQQQQQQGQQQPDLTQV
jgi:cytochrome P450